jgi:hypothetical protein
MNMWGTGYKIPCVNLLKSNNLLNHHVLPFQMKNSITIRSWLKKSSGYRRRRVIVRGSTKVMTTPNELLRRRINRRGGLNGRRRRNILNERRRWHIRRELIRERWSIRQACSTTVVELSLEVSPCCLEPQEETQRMTHRAVKSSDE